MRFSEARRHWCRADFATTCIVRYHQHRCRLAVRVPLTFLEGGFDTRGGLYFANPYLTDWALALGLRGDPSAGKLRLRLISEILAGRRDDGLVGMFDTVLSTGLALAALAVLGCSDAELCESREALAIRLMADREDNHAVPFYSSEMRDASSVAAGLAVFSALLAKNPHLVKCAGQNHAVSYYEDSHDLITTAVSLLALAPGQGVKVSSGADPALSAHPRYRCPTQADYIGRYALPPYLH